MSEKKKEVIVEYTSIAYPPEGIDANLKYLYGKDDKGDYLSYGGVKQYINAEFVKALFSVAK